MKDTIVGFQVAKLAKEKGFDIECGERYMPNKTVQVATFKDHNSTKMRYSAPTQSLLQKWLREKHNIHVNVSKELTFTFKINGDLKGNKYINYSDIEKYWGRSYEEVLEKGLIEALKLIK